MLEWLAAATGVELGRLVLEQVLNLGKAALEDYVKDFFKDCLQSGVARANAAVLKQPMAEAIGFFIRRFIKELQFNDVPETSIEHHFKKAIQGFVRDRSVRPILGKAFDKDCKQIDFVQLQQIWTQQYQIAGWQFPAEEFDWRGVAKEYVVEVKGIIKANPELRSILEAELLEEIARNTTRFSPGFDVAKYRDSLQCSYGALKLSTIDTTDQQYQIKLWNLFIEQTVREALPPIRYELPIDLKRRLQNQGQLEADLSGEALELYRREYFQQPVQKVLEALRSPLVPLQKGENENIRAVILGDPGSGKSTLLQYLALEWVEGSTETLPLLIELREYVLAESAHFLDFLHRGRGADWQFDQQQLHQYLSENPTLVMFDGLDEVFDRSTQAAVIDDIIRFSQQYPNAQVLVTSRIIGYNPDRFQQAGFRQFTIQPLDETEIHEFIDRWYDLAMGSDPDKTRLKQRLKDAIANSKAIQNLADNPLLLTMMAILNRRWELPRDRADLYDQASRVLLYHWDVDHKRLKLPMDAIGRREKQEMLRLIAYEMQAGEEGLKGNLIGIDRLTRVITDYLHDQRFSEPREKANLLIQQLRERNFILCYRGADTYGFMHRTFLEYFCAVEIVNRFEKVRSISFEELRDRVFGEHWQDETWHEVLRLICGMIDSQFADQLIEFLMVLKLDQKQLLIEDCSQKENKTFEYKRLVNLLLAADCLLEIGKTASSTSLQNQLLQKLRAAVEQPENPLTWEEIDAVVRRVIQHTTTIESLSWLKQLTQIEENSTVPPVAIWAIAKHFPADFDTLSWLKEVVQSEKGSGELLEAAILAICEYFYTELDTLIWLKQLVHANKHWVVQWDSVAMVAKYFSTELDTLPWLKKIAETGTHWAMRGGAVQSIGEFFNDHPDTLPLLKKFAQRDKSQSVQRTALRQIAKHFAHFTDTFDLVYRTAQTDPDIHIRQKSLQALFAHYPTHPKTIELLRDRAVNDPDEQLRAWAQEQLQKMESERQ